MSVVAENLENTRKILYTSNERLTLSNSNTETSVLSSTVNIPANTLKVGDLLDFSLYGKLSTASIAPSTTIKIKFNSANLINNSVTVTANLAAALIEAKAKISIKSIGPTGVAVLMGNTFAKDDINFSAGAFRALIGTDISIDTTSDIVLDVTYTFNNASTSNILVTDIVEVSLSRK